MAVSKFTSSSNVNDFNLNIGSTYSVVTLTQEYPIGAYSFTSSLNDSSIDLYFYSGSGTLVGYTNTKGVIVTSGFNKIVIIGGTVGDVLSFTFKTTYNTTSETTEIGAGPVILSTTPLSLPNINSTTVVTGLNFATDIAATFTGTDNLARNAKSVVRGSANSLVITRPDTLPIAYSPYTLTVANPSVGYQPTGSNSNTISITAGTNPVWQTTSTPAVNINVVYSYSLVATKSDTGGSISSYTVISGSLPTGLSLNTSSGLISGTPTVGGNYSFTVRATDSGGNTADLVLSIGVISGGTLTSDATYFYRTFNANGTFLTGALNADILAISGGGAGGAGFNSQAAGGGGGAGGVLYTASQTLTSGSYTVAVGAGGLNAGAGAAAPYTSAVVGVRSSFTGGSILISPYGGGGGTSYPDDQGYPAVSVGSGGGAGGAGRTGTNVGGQAGTSGQGGNGGYQTGTGQSNGSTSCGGGGGAGGNGGSGTASSVGGNGGSGTNTYASWITAITSAMTSVSGWSTATSTGYIAGGGGGACTANGQQAQAGVGGGGRPGAGTGNTGGNNGNAGIDNTGGGGGGASAGSVSTSGGNGGSGIVVVRYAKSAVYA